MTQTIKERCKELGITYQTYRSRLKRGWSKEKALSIPKVVAQKNEAPDYQVFEKDFQERFRKKVLKQ